MFTKVALLAVACLVVTPLFGIIFQNIHGVVHDPQHRPIPDASVEIHATNSTWSQTVKTNAGGEFQLDAVPIGQYVIGASAKGFAAMRQAVNVTSEPLPILHLQLKLATVSQSVEVSAAPVTVNPESSTTQTSLNRTRIAETPGADRTDSLAMITDYVPGAYMVHDMLHIRGGHQVTWQIDGVPVPNTNIADNVGPQFDPNDVDYMETQRGGYSAQYGSETYGVFNVEPRTGFEGNNFGEFQTTFGSFNQTNNYVDFGSHTDRFAYYASLNGNRTDLGLETPTTHVLHDLGDGFGGFTSLIFNATPKDQLRFVSSLRRDFFQVPNTPEQQQAGIGDVDRESDAFANFSWVHTQGPELLWTVSPYYHFNRAHYIGGPNDVPVIPEDDRGSQYAGGQVTLAVTKEKHSINLGFDAFAQHDNTLFGLTESGGAGLSLSQRVRQWGGVEALFAQDSYRITDWLTLNGGLRYTHYSGSVTENAFDPRVGTAIRLPRLGWVLRGFYGRYYNPPPLETVAGPLLAFALQQGFGFLPLKGERDEQWEVGLAIPAHGWTLNFDHFHTRGRNFFDHDILGNSNIYFPLTIDTARIQGDEATVRSPMLARRLQMHVAFSHQTAQGRGAVTGGLTDFSPPEGQFFYLDHDQRVTVNTVFNAILPWQSSASVTVHYGSGFLNGDGPAHLPGHTTVNLSLGKQFRESWWVGVTALNIANNQYLLDNSSTFGGTHFVNPREVYAQLRYKFHF